MLVLSLFESVFHVHLLSSILKIQIKILITLSGLI